MAGWRSRKKEHSDRDDLAGEHPFGDAGQIVLACVFGVVWFTDSVFLEYTTFLNQHVPEAARIPVAVAVLVLSGYLAKKGLSQVFDEVRAEPVVIRKGVFGVVRHPVYLSEILLYLGFLMFSISIAAVAVWVAGIVFLHYLSRYEEKLLLARFGDEYKRYMRDVPMWIPGLRRK
jgi:protein-S-isoprenylcysteine O-methyltransferase Ste14